jgi:hypothetical protein
MNNIKRSLRFSATMINLMILMMSSFSGNGIAAHASSGRSASGSSTTFLPLEMNNFSSDTIVYLPLVLNQFPLQTVFGVAMEQITAGWGLEQLAAANTSWTRPIGISWSAVEPSEARYDWSILSDLDGELMRAAQKGMQVVLLVHSTPEWARKLAGTGSSCGPVAVDKFAAFANFMRELVRRYSKAPYFVKYWEIWNEPDIDPSLVPADNPYGCWGDAQDEYYGGGYFADFLKVVYPQIKSGDADAQVMVGGLLLECDPRGGCEAKGKSNLPNMFLEGILLNGGGPYFDGISFHAYDYYSGELGKYSNSNWLSAWNITGPVGFAKVQFIREILAKYGVTGKFLMNTESALICGETGNEPLCQTADFSFTKAYYLTQSYALAISQELRGNIWHHVFGWRGSGLLNESLIPLPAFNAFQFARSELRNGQFLGYVTAIDIGVATGIQGYKIQRGDRFIWILWSLDGNPHTITLSSTPEAAWDALGGAIVPAAAMEVTVMPEYLEFLP